MRDRLILMEKLGAEARALFHQSTGYCATPRARARAAYLARQEEEQAAKIVNRRFGVDPETKLCNGEIE
jgi:hypothetical protein